jgi:ElaB/YqjD/DUF883 family membrane-anchored ribosome-binding protein
MSEKETKDAADKFQSGKSHATEAAKDIRAAAEAKLNDLRDTLNQRAGEYRERAGQVWSDTTVRARTLTEEGEGYIRENPLQAVGIALAALDYQKRLFESLTAALTAMHIEPQHAPTLMRATFALGSPTRLSSLPTPMRARALQAECRRPRAACTVSTLRRVHGTTACCPRRRAPRSPCACSRASLSRRARRAWRRRPP